ncbi:hypothetical protein glysoja_034057 [Glycine soja]|uniref:Uncharacterized protein n=1 Tax=Glycine soja TaxID=3848 RepID=A0A0B2RED4_GLYSO|nr:hypothetical protein glysoja_034057 [Glycine soja]
MLRVHDSEHIQEDVVAEESHGSFQPTVDAVQEHVPSAEESPEEPQKHTYASIAGSVEVAGRQVYIEERRPNRKGRGRSSYQSEVQRGRFGPRSFGRVSGQDGEYNKPKGIGFYGRNIRQERGYSGYQWPSNGQNLAE